MYVTQNSNISVKQSTHIQPQSFLDICLVYVYYAYMDCIIIYFKMSGHEELPADIRKQLLELQSKLSGLKALMGSSKE